MMSEAVPFLPQLDRLLRRIETAESPLVQLWGWPGTGKMALLEGLLARQGRRAIALPMAAMASEESLREALEAAHDLDARWLVAIGAPAAERLPQLERWLRPGQRLVFAGDRRSPGDFPREVLAPQELLLREAEMLALGSLLTGQTCDPETVRSLWEATDGWYRPVRLALDATGGSGLRGAGPDELLGIPAVRHFLRHEVLDSFAEEEKPLLLDAPDERPAIGQAGEEAWRLLDERGLWIDGPDRDRLPRLLGAALARERHRRRPEPPISAPPPADSTREAPAARPVYSLGLLGSPIARQRDEQGERELDCRLRRSFQVLAFLASAPGLQAGREELIEAVWPTEGERTIERNFHPTLSHLRRALEGGRKGKNRPAPLLFRSGVYRLNPEVAWEIDALELGRLADEGRERLERGELDGAAEAWQRGWKLYRGPFLQGYYEGWVTARRETCQRLYLELLRDLGDLYVRLGRSEDAMDAYRTVLVEDPLQERIHLAVMRLYAAQGRRDLVRRQFDKLSSLLLDELGVAPMPHTTRDYHRLMA